LKEDVLNNDEIERVYVLMENEEIGLEEYIELMTGCEKVENESKNTRLKRDAHDDFLK